MDNISPIWFDKSLGISHLKTMGTIFMSHTLGMEWEGITANTLQMSMPVNDNSKQPYGLLHGGASCALAETVGSVASFLVIDSSKFICMGQEISASHLRPVNAGKILATATPLHLGRTTHVWDIRLEDESENLVCICRLTVAIRPKH